jgi:L-lactate dehydrogenase complex protein LldG
MTPREQVFSTIRRSLGVNGLEAPRAAIVAERLARRAPGVLPARAQGKSAAQRVELFIAMAEASAATLSVVAGPHDVPAAVADYLRGHNLAPTVRRGDDPRLSGLPWAETALGVSTGRSFGDDESAVSAAFGGVAETGTLVLASGPDNPTTLNFLPDNHIVVLDAADVAATYEDVWTRLRARYGDGLMPRAVNWITGPSRSADIEQILLMGAHGPRRLHIVLIDPAARSAEADGTAAAAPADSTPSPVEVRSTLNVDADTPEGGDERPDERKPDKPPSDTPAKTPQEEDDDDKLDEELDDSFPASDPPASTQP